MRRLTMTRFVLFLLLAGLLAAGCGGANSVEPDPDAGLKERARVAERNLMKMREAVLDYHKLHDEAPADVEQLGEVELEASDDYSDIAYWFQNLEFEDGKMSSGWFFATPRADSDAFKVRLNGATGEFDYTPHDQPFAPAKSDNSRD